MFQSSESNGAAQAEQTGTNGNVQVSAFGTPHIAGPNKESYPSISFGMGHITSGVTTGSTAGFTKFGFRPASIIPEVLHHEIHCDGCRSNPIRGIRYKCSTCANFDYCSTCISVNETGGSSEHPRNHLFLRISSVVPYTSAEPIKSAALMNRSLWVHGVACNNCSADIIGYRYLCTQCAISLCESCDQLGEHNLQHNMIRMTPANPINTLPLILQKPHMKNAFGNSLHSILRSDGVENICFSPLLIEMCVKLAMNGAHGRTQDEMIRTLQCNNMVSIDAINTEAKALLQSLLSSQTVIIANSIWISSATGLQFDQVYAQTLSQYYDAVANVMHAPHDVNIWCASKTNQRIKEVLTTRQDPAALVNAIYFEDNWAKQFQPSQTRTAPFFSLGNTKTSVMMMSQQDHYNYIEDAKFQAVKLPYCGPLCAVVVLPKADYDMDQLLSFDEIWPLLSRPTQLGIVELPKFKSDSTYELKGVLSQMGMPSLFDPSHQMATRDLDPMAASAQPRRAPLYVTSCLHKVFVEVNEKGIDATAVRATAAPVWLGTAATVVKATAVPLVAFHMVCNHPFLFYICTKDVDSSGSVRVVFQSEICRPTLTPNPPGTGWLASSFGMPHHSSGRGEAYGLGGFKK